MTPKRERRILLRSFLVQGAWNPRDLQGTGVAWILDEPPPPGRGPEPFNAHPYLAGVALGALARETEEGTLTAEERGRLRAALRGPLGALGDGLVWAGWLPALLLVALLLLLLALFPGISGFQLPAEAPGVPAFPAPGETPGALEPGGGGAAASDSGFRSGWGGTALALGVVGGFLLLHNLLHLGLRQWAVSFGYRHGAGVGAALGRTHLRALGERARQISVFLAGMLGGAAALAGALLLGGGLRGGAAVAAGSLFLLALGSVLAGRLPVTTPTRVAALLLAAGWLASLV